MRQFIVKNNNRLQANAQFVPLIVHSLLDLLLRVEESSFFIPSFDNILIDEKTMELSLVLFSFAGVEVFERSASIAGHQIKEIAAFFESDHFSSQKRGINIRRAFCIVVLGLLIDKAIDLIPKETFGSQAVSMATFEGLIRNNAVQFSKILGSKVVKSLLKELKEKCQLSFELPMSQFLSREMDLSWG